MNFQDCFWKGFKHKALSGKDNPLKVPIGNIRDPSNLDFAGGVDVAAEDLARGASRDGIENLNHGTEELSTKRLLYKD